MPPKDLPRRSPRKPVTERNASPAGIAKRLSTTSPSPQARAEQITSWMDAIPRQEPRLVDPKGHLAKMRLIQHAEFLHQEVPARDNKGQDDWQKQITMRIRHALSDEPVTISGWIKRICCGLSSHTDGTSYPRLLGSETNEVAKFILSSVVKPYALKWHLSDNMSVAAACVVTANQMLGGGWTMELAASTIAGFEPFEETNEEKANDERWERSRKIAGDLKRAKVMLESAMEAQGGWTEVFLQAVEEQVVGPKASVAPVRLYP